MGHAIYDTMIEGRRTCVLDGNGSLETTLPFIHCYRIILVTETACICLHSGTINPKVTETLTTWMGGVRISVLAVDY